MKNKIIAATLGIAAVILIFLTPFFPFDEAIAAVIAIIIGVMKE